MHLPRAATLDDAAEIARLSAILGYPAPEEVFVGRLRHLLESDTHAVFVAERAASALGGFVAVEHRLLLESGDRVEIVALAVDPAVRRGGLGRLLVAAAEDWAKQQGVDEVFLRSNVQRPEAHAFYPALGYARSKTQHAYRRRLDGLIA